MKVYVDKINADGTVGIATNEAMMKKNIDCLEIMWKNNIKELALIFPAGRFVCSVTITHEMSPIMIFIDFKKDREKALFAANKYEDPGTRKIFMEVFEKVNNIYDEKYNEVQLVLDKNFIPDIIPN